MATSAGEFDREIKQKIPITEKMGVTVVEFNPSTVRLAVQYSPNRNHVDSVFGGSIYSAAALACYGLFRAMAESHGYTEEFLVIQKAEIEYLSPVLGDFQVLAAKGKDLDFDFFLASVRRQKKGRLPLFAEVIHEQKVCARFNGTYVLRIP